MSYSRQPYYIYPTGDGVQFTGGKDGLISDDEMDVFLYKLLVTRPGEFMARILNGKDVIEGYFNGTSDLAKQTEAVLKTFHEDFNLLNTSVKDETYLEWLKDKEAENKFYQFLIKTDTIWLGAKNVMNSYE